MKKILFTLTLLLAATQGMKAQAVFNEIKSMAQAVASDKTPDNAAARQINQFKLAALDYLLVKMREQMPDSSVTMLDRQALALNQFINAYVKFLTGSVEKSKKIKAEMLKSFMEASYNNPLFKDPDTDMTLSYFNNESCITRFSLDTDWVKARKAVVITQ